ncbi:hypothetical protein EDD22DRAFT_979942 [Suillus occidentalis]|nr:hypothetical protein EDD22DRAFT_979942 [Suillus occidentalis]
MKHNDFEAMREHNTYYPFTDRAEWELAKFLCDNLNQGQITRFLKLLWVVSEARQPLSFKNAKQLFTFMDALPVALRWKCMPIHTDGYTTTHPVDLIWRDALEVMHHIFGNPIFANHMEYNPYEIKDNGECEYGEWMSCEQASEIQNDLPIGATIVPIILASDKTPVTRQTGSLEMHPTFLMLGNIHSEHVWHKCMDLVLEKLKVAAEVGEFMVDPMGCHRYAFTPLAAHIADLPEQIMISIFRSRRSSILSVASTSHIGSNWGRADPSIFLVPEILHACHKFFFDHPLKWCKEVIGASELDARFRSQHKRVGTRHFTDGVSHVNQMTGREHRDIQRTLVPTIVGVTSPGSHFTSSSLDSMVSSLNEFHAYKHFILEAEARTGTSGPISHFQIPKLESFNSFARSIRQSGAIIQFSVDVSKRLLITHCKTPFQRTSHQQGTFTQQIVNIINREEVMRQFDLYALLRERWISHQYLTFSWIARVALQDMHRFQAICPVRNHFLKGLLSDEANAAFHVTIAHNLADRSPTALAQLYHLSQFPNVLSQYLDGVSGRNSLFHGCLLKTWYKFRLQLHSRLRPCNIMPSQQVQVYPPSEMHPFGNCNMVLLQPTSANPQSTPCIVQVRMGQQLPTELKEPLLYVELFEIAAPPEAEPHIGIRTRIGKIVRLVDVTHAVELIPIYGETMDRSVSSTTSLERYDNFYLNAFSDKEWYHTLHADFV